MKPEFCVTALSININDEVHIQSNNNTCCVAELQLAVSERASSVVEAGNGIRQLDIAPPPYDEDMPQTEQDSPRLYVLVHI